jgi:hypothetical protein
VSPILPSRMLYHSLGAHVRRPTLQTARCTLSFLIPSELGSLSGVCLYNVFTHFTGADSIGRLYHGRGVERRGCCVLCGAGRLVAQRCRSMRFLFSID